MSASNVGAKRAFEAAIPAVQPEMAPHGVTDRPTRIHTQSTR
jgi:hypothetical protein